jgi:uncharacterized protein (TIGR02284 family)
MTIETSTKLSSEVVATLQDLIRINIDAAKGFDEAADNIEIQSVAETFRQLAIERNANSNELTRFIELNHAEAVDSGSILGAIHRTWIDFRSALSGGDAYVILSEAEKGEDSIKKSYEDALAETTGSAIHSVLSQQFIGIKRGHDRVRDLRDEFAQD